MTVIMVNTVEINAIGRFAVSGVGASKADDGIAGKVKSVCCTELSET